MTMYQMALMKWVSVYLKAGWSLIPLRMKSKEPLIPWTEFRTRKASLDEVKGWITKWPEMNLGLVTGDVSKLVVVDLDGANGLKYGQLAGLASSVIARTGKGKQLFYKWTEPIDNSASKIAPNVDVRGDGGYVVVSPSVHPNGRRYHWEKFVPQSISIFPTEIIPATSDSIASSNKIGIPQGKPDGWISQALKEMKNGNIDDTLVSILGKMRRDNWTAEDARCVLEPIAREKGATDGHVEDKIRNIWTRYEPKRDELSMRMSGASPRYEGISDSNANEPFAIHSPDNDDSYERFSRSMESRTVSGLQTGFPTLDKYFEGGLKSERLFTVAARTGVGKTNFGIALSSNLCGAGHRVLYFSTEFQYQKVWNRYIATLKDPKGFREHPFYVVDAYSPNLSQVEEAIKKVKPEVFIFDFIQHIGKEKEILTQFMRGCQFLQRQYGCQGVILAQLNRNADWVEAGKRVEPRMSMIEGSSTIEQASSRVLLLSEVRVTPEYNELIGVLDKNDTGDKGIINFALYKNPYIFKELTA